MRHTVQRLVAHTLCLGTPVAIGLQPANPAPKNHRLLNKVIDLEVATGTPSPTIDPSVRVILVGHSMGGIVAAETAIALASEHPIHNSVDEDSPTKSTTNLPPAPNALMFPYIQGVLAFDTPFLGISPGVVAHGAESHYAAASTAIAQLSGLTSLWSGAKAAEASAAGRQPQQQPVGALPPAAEVSKDGKDKDKSGTNSGGGWGRWGVVAAAAGAVGAAAVGGAAAYYKREQITQTLSWATSHLEFVGCLARKEELRRRVAYMVRLNRELGVGFGNLYTRLGQSAGAKQVSMVGTVLGKDRTFCVVPQRDQAGDWRPAVNDKAKDETGAHMCECCCCQRFAHWPRADSLQLCLSPRRTRATRNWQTMPGIWWRVGCVTTGMRAAQMQSVHDNGPVLAVMMRQWPAFAACSIHVQRLNNKLRWCITPEACGVP